MRLLIAAIAYLVSLVAVATISLVVILLLQARMRTLSGAHWRWSFWPLAGLRCWDCPHTLPIASGENWANARAPDDFNGSTHPFHFSGDTSCSNAYPAAGNSSKRAARC